MKVDIEPELSRVDAKLLIPGRGDPIEDASLIFTKDSITFVGPTKHLSPKHSSLQALKVPVLMPGLWDCHVHFLGMNLYSVDVAANTNPVVAGIRSARDAIACLNAGVTSVRELAGYGVQLSKVIDEGWIAGPNIYSAVSLISQTGGHGDARSIELDRFHELIDQNHIPFHICDGIDECVKAVRIQVRKGAKVIKVAASGGVTSEGDDVMAQQFSDEELEAMVKEAERSSLIVAAHAHGKRGIMAALKAGCRTIEHGTFLDDEAIALMREKDAMLIATADIARYVIKQMKPGSPEWKQAHKMIEQHKISYRKAIAAGVRCAIGTDVGVSSHTPPRFGMNGLEIRHAVEAGMTPLEAIEAATANGPDTLGPKAPKSGRLEEGYDVDLIALEKNPLEDVSILGDPNQIIHVWKGGKQLKKDGMPIGILDDL